MKVVVVGGNRNITYKIAAYITKYHKMFFNCDVSVEDIDFLEFCERMQDGFMNDDIVLIGVIENSLELNKAGFVINKDFYYNGREHYGEFFDFMISHNPFDNTSVMEADRFNDNCIRTIGGALERARLRLILKMYPLYKSIGKDASPMDITDI